LPVGCVAIVGYAERSGDRVFNTAAVVTRDAYIGGYLESHLWGEEPALFDAGDEVGVLVSTPVGRLKVAIC
jgi:predicted amidohydrolase